MSRYLTIDDATHQGEDDSRGEYPSDSTEGSASCHGDKTILHPPKQRTWLSLFGMQLFCAAWLGPIIALLWLNFTEKVIGQSAWCPGGQCTNGTFDDPRLATLYSTQYAKQDHNLLGALQLVAKGLEIWFVVIALWLLYLVTMRMAHHRDGLPLEYMLRTADVGHLWINFKPAMWSPMTSRDSGPNRGRLVLFFLLAFLLSIISALMGPATAILVLPSQKWTETATMPFTRFEAWNAREPPGLDAYYLAATSCTQEDLDRKRWSCAYSYFGKYFDSWYVDRDLQDDQWWFQVNGFRFVTNYSAANFDDAAQLPIWVPSFQVIRRFVDDVNRTVDIQTAAGDENLKASVSDFLYQQYAVWKKALQMEFHQRGPILSSLSNFWPPPYRRSGPYTFPTTSNTSIHVVQVDQTKSIRCYPYWSYRSHYELPANNYTRCIQAGQGWGDFTRQETFNISKPLFERMNATLDVSSLMPNSPNLTVTVLASEKAAFFPDGAFPSWLDPRCLQTVAYLSDITGLKCDWDAFFALNESSNSAMQNLTRFANTVEMFKPNLDPSVPLSGSTYAFDFVVFRNFTDYIVDPSYIRNPSGIIQTRDPPRSGTAIPLDPNWYLATLSVNANGTISQSRSVPLLTLASETAEGLVPGDPFVQALRLLSDTTVLYMLANIDYNTTALPSQDPKLLADQAYRQANGQLDDSILTFQTRYFTWAYGMESRSSRFAAVVAGIGIIIVAAHLVLASIDRREHRSLTDVLASALQHVPRNNEFADVEQVNDDKAVSRTRYRMIETEGRLGHLLFERVRTTKV